MDLTGINQRPQDNFDFNDELLATSQQESYPYELEIDGLPFVIHAGVFAVNYFPGADLYSRWLRFKPGTAVLEIGTGTGVVSVLAGLAGARQVVATDINPAAVTNARANVAMHKLEDRVDVRQGDVFDPILPDERFDLIFWNFPWVLVDPDFQPTDLQRACVDPGYRAIRRYITEGPGLLTPDGRLTLAISTTLGRYDLIQEIAAEVGLEAHIVESGQIADPLPTPISVELVQFVAKGDRPHEP